MAPPSSPATLPSRCAPAGEARRGGCGAVATWMQRRCNAHVRLTRAAPASILPHSQAFPAPSFGNLKALDTDPSVGEGSKASA